MPGRHRDESLLASARRLYAQGHDSYQIGERLGVDPTTVQRWVSGEARRRGPRGRTDVTGAKIIMLRDESALEGGKPMSFAEIGRRVHMSATGVRMRYYALTGRARPDRS